MDVSALLRGRTASYNIELPQLRADNVLQRYLLIVMKRSKEYSGDVLKDSEDQYMIY